VSFIVVLSSIGLYYWWTGTPPGARLIEQEPPTASGLDDNQANFMFFYATWCPHCKTAQQPWHSLKQFIKNNLQYPSKATQKNIDGICKMKVSILPDGTVTQPIIINSLGKHFDKEVLRVFNLMPKKWLPAMNDDKPFESEKEIEFEFKIPK